MFVKSSVGFVLSNCLNAKKKYIWNGKYTIQHSIERSQTIKCIQYNIHDIKSCELPKYSFSSDTKSCKINLRDIQQVSYADI